MSWDPTRIEPLGEPARLQTPRLVLRPWEDADRAPFAALNADPDVMRHFPSVLTREASDRSIDAWNADFARRGWSNWAVVLRTDAGDAGGDAPPAGTFIGFVGLTIPWRTLPFTPCVEIGWRLARAHWHRGYATEAAREALRFGFERLALDEIVSFTALTNTPSQAVMQRIGMLDSGEDFDHPALPEGSPLRRHCLYRLGRERWSSSASSKAAG